MAPGAILRHRVKRTLTVYALLVSSLTFPKGRCSALSSVAASYLRVDIISLWYQSEHPGLCKTVSYEHFRMACTAAAGCSAHSACRRLCTCQARMPEGTPCIRAHQILYWARLTSVPYQLSALCNPFIKVQEL